MVCHDPQMRLTLYFSRMIHQTTGAAVTSLQVKPGSEDVVSVECVESGEPASTGNLQLGIDLDMLVDPVADSPAVTAIKDFTDQVFKKGPIVAAIKAGSGSVLLSGGTAGLVDTPFEGSRYGVVTISVLEGVLGGELPIDLVKLDGVTEEAFEEVLGLGLPPDQTTSYRGRIRVPVGIAVATLSVVWRAWILGRSAGDIPPLNMTYRRIPRPSPATTPIDLPVDEVTHVLDTSTLDTYDANQYAEVSSDPITVEPGDVLLFTIERPAAGGDSYEEEIHIIDQRMVIVGTT